MSLTIQLIAADALATPTDAIIVGVFEDSGLTPAASAFDRQSGGAISRALEQGDASARLAAVSRLTGLSGLPASRLILVGLGNSSALDAAGFIKAVHETAKTLKAGPVRHAVSFLGAVAVVGRDGQWLLDQQVIGFSQHGYRYAATKPRKAGDEGLSVLAIAAADGLDSRGGEAVAAGITLARELGNLPPNLCTPTHLAETALRLAGELPNFRTEILDQADMEKLGMGALLGVARGSVHPPKLIVMHYRGAGDAAPQVLVGKGVTFDTGGISIKPGAAMDEMKYDMCGAAAVFGTLQAVARIGLPLNAIGIVPAVENMPDGNAYRPGDVLSSMSGQTIEVLNTDAEGRLILCDALHYARRFKPERLLDIATLTGACVVALGKHAHGLMSEDDTLADELLAAGVRVHDRAWRLPLWRDYQSQLDSNFADMANIGGKHAGAITAGCFLSRFTRDLRWAHLDIAGTAWDEGRKGGATGRPVAMLVEWLRGCAAARD
ncbi:MAG: leucyl aminopeptidase [Lysobacterales bacterium]